MTMSELGARLRQARETRGLTQAGLSRLTGINQPTLSGYQTGRRTPNAANLVKLSRALQVRSDWLLGLPDWDNCPPYFASARIDDLFAKLATATAADIEIVATIADAILDRTNR